MSKHDPKAVFMAIKEAVELAMDKFGIDAIKNLSMFPSSRKEDAEEKEAA